MLSSDILNQTKDYLHLLQEPVEFILSSDKSATSAKMKTFIQQFCSLDERLTFKEKALDYTPAIAIKRPGKTPQIVFAMLPVGHEYATFLLAVLQLSGHAPKITEEQKQRIQAIHRPLTFKSFVTVNCKNCPDIMQYLNILCILNPHIQHVIIDGHIFPEEAETHDILSVPTTFLNHKFFCTGNQTMQDILHLLTPQTPELQLDVLIIGDYMTEEAQQLCDNLQISYMVVSPTALPTSIRHTVSKRLTFQTSHQVQTDYQTITAKAVILSMKAKTEPLYLPGEQTFANHGLFYQQAPSHLQGNIALIGNTDKTALTALTLAKNKQNHITILSEESFQFTETFIQLLQRTANIHLIKNCLLEAFEGDVRLQRIIYNQTALDVDYCLIQQPMTTTLTSLPENLDVQHHRIQCDHLGQTNLPGIFAAGIGSELPYDTPTHAATSLMTAILSAYYYIQ